MTRELFTDEEVPGGRKWESWDLIPPVERRVIE
jgi:hypothetical protein